MTGKEAIIALKSGKRLESKQYYNCWVEANYHKTHAVTDAGSVIEFSEVEKINSWEVCNRIGYKKIDKSGMIGALYSILIFVPYFLFRYKSSGNVKIGYEPFDGVAAIILVFTFLFIAHEIYWGVIKRKYVYKYKNKRGWY